MALTLTSPAFSEGADIPVEHTCEGRDLSPPLQWSGAPAGTKSFALVIDDPDAPDPANPKRTWVHWVVYDIPAGLGALRKGVSSRELKQMGIRVGRNDWKKAGYGGPCPPIGRHRYFHKLYALDVVLPDLGTPTKAGLENAMRGHVLAQATLMGGYEKQKEARPSR